MKKENMTIFVELVIYNYLICMTTKVQSHHPINRYNQYVLCGF
ncbi:hypothetical protein CRENPOLYSF1_50068 [Crenothrix polyspora]|uniref:Uncharacterized protein n=1 Tax=Crenothrix polyspora TaxID=360316 RepID=A0A1R4HDQ1_9GAMM|nr:hypothetical protein CRENPOLYSF1_50068 [Crenothrix polyspora]